jgi:hypothetical protein
MKKLMADLISLLKQRDEIASQPKSRCLMRQKGAECPDKHYIVTSTSYSLIKST